MTVIRREHVEYTTSESAAPKDPIADTTAPVITLLGADPMELNVGDTFNDPGATATDDTDGDLTSSIQTSSNIDTSVAGSYTVTYTVSDTAGNTASATRSVVVIGNPVIVDTTAPAITLLGTDPMNLNVGDTFSDPGATATDDIDGDLTALIQSSSNVDTSVTGNYTVIYTVTDSSGNSAETTRSVVVTDRKVEVYTLQSRVLESADDAEERANGTISFNSSDLELVEDRVLQTVGIRFTNLAIPQNATITKAYIQFTANAQSAESAELNIYGENTDNATAFSKTKRDISSRTQTAASASWVPVEWNSVGAAGVEQRTSDLTSIVQEIVFETGWKSGNAMAFIITGNGKRVAASYDGDQTGAPMFYVEYTTGTAN